jgi:hypothetical protein
MPLLKIHDMPLLYVYEDINPATCSGYLTSHHQAVDENLTAINDIVSKLRSILLYVRLLSAVKLNHKSIKIVIIRYLCVI